MNLTSNMFCIEEKLVYDNNKLHNLYCESIFNIFKRISALSIFENDYLCL